MKSSSWLHYVWKAPVCVLAFWIGFMVGGPMATAMGLATPSLPAGTDQATLMMYTLLGSLIFVIALATIAKGVSGGFLTRWLVLFFFAWITYAVNNYFEVAIFTTMSAASLYVIVVYFPALLFCSAMVAWLFQPGVPSTGFFRSVRTFFANYSPRAWGWRLLAAFLAFPIIYYIFGRLIAPFVLEYYQQGTFELTLPGWDQILPVLALRSLIFLLACMPVLITWKNSRKSLVVVLGLVLFIFVGGVNMLAAVWMAPALRIAHSLEMFADEIVYAGALVYLLTQSESVAIHASHKNAKVIASR